MTTLPTKPINPLTATRADLAGVFRAAANIVDGGPLHTGGLWSNDHPYNWEPGVPISPAAALCAARRSTTQSTLQRWRTTRCRSSSATSTSVTASTSRSGRSPPPTTTRPSEWWRRSGRSPTSWTACSATPTRGWGRTLKPSPSRGRQPHTPHPQPTKG
jgi:hypothetical protein